MWPSIVALPYFAAAKGDTSANLRLQVIDSASHRAGVDEFQCVGTKAIP